MQEADKPLTKWQMLSQKIREEKPFLNDGHLMQESIKQFRNDFQFKEGVDFWKDCTDCQDMQLIEGQNKLEGQKYEKRE